MFNRMKKLLPLMLVMLLLFSTFSFAAEDAGSAISVAPEDVETLGIMFTETLKEDQYKDNILLTPKDGGTEVAMVTYTGNKLLFYVDNFNNATSSSKKKALKTFVEVLQQSRVSAQGQQNIYDQMANLDDNINTLLLPLVFDDTKADVFGGMLILKPFMNPLQKALGVGAIIIMFLLIISTVADLVYIGLPMIRGDDSEGKSKSKPFMVSSDAVAAVKQSESSMSSDGGNMKNTYWVYLRRRTWTYIILGICILYLVMGKLSGVMSFILDLGGGLVGN